MDSHSGDDSSDDSHTRAELGSADPFRRARATLRLGRHADPQAFDQLLALLDDPDWPVVKAALKALRRYRDPRIVPAVQAVAARHRSFATLSRAGAISFPAARVLLSQGEAGFQALLTMLCEFKNDEVWGQAAVRYLAVLRDPRAIEPLIDCFDSPVYEVANAASRVMRHFGTAAIPPLIEALSITDQSPYFHVVWALRWIGAPAVPALLDALRHADDEDIRSGAADVLGRPDIDSEDVREALYAALDDEDADVRRMAMWSLGELGDPRVLELLLAVQPDPKSVWSDPARTISDIGSAAVPPLITALGDQARPAYQRVNAARALGEIEDERTVEPLVAALRDDNEEVRAAAIFALGMLAYARAVKPLLAAFTVEPLLAVLHDDPSSEVRRRAIGELASMDDDRAFDAVARFVRESGEDEESDKFTSGLLRDLALHHGARTLPLLSEIALGSVSQKWLSAGFALSKLGSPGVSVLLEIGRDPQQQRRHTAIDWLKMAYRHSPDPRIVEFLFEIIQENDTSTLFAKRMRYHATLALGECSDPRSVGPLLEVLHDAPSMRYSVVQLLGELGDERALAALTAVYEEGKAKEDGPDVGEQPGQRHEFQIFQDALVWAIAKIRERLNAAGADEDSFGSSAAT